MKTLTKAERTKLTAAVLYPEDEDAQLTLRQVADMTNRDIRVIRHYVKKGTLPAVTNDKGAYLVRAKHVAIVLWQPAWGEKRRRSRVAPTIRRTTVPGATPEAPIG